MHEAAVAAQCSVANAATPEVGQPIVVDEANAAVIHWPHCIDNMEVIDRINRAILASTNMIREVIRAKDATAATRVAMANAAADRTGAAATLNAKLELLQKQCKLAIGVGNLMLISHCK